MAVPISIGFDIFVLTMRVGGIRIVDIAAGDSGEYTVWMPFGLWQWSPETHRPIPEYWQRPQQGNWRWLVDNPAKTHILLREGTRRIGAIADFNRSKRETYQEGGWVMNYEGWDMGGTWKLGSTAYDRNREKKKLNAIRK